MKIRSIKDEETDEILGYAVITEYRDGSQQVITVYPDGDARGAIFWTDTAGDLCHTPFRKFDFSKFAYLFK